MRRRRGIMIRLQIAAGTRVAADLMSPAHARTKSRHNLFTIATVVPRPSVSGTD